MDFGIFYEHQLPRPWAEGAEERLIRDALEQVELADRLGIDYLWEVEHHFLEEYSHSPAPEVFLAAASQRTSNIRLGHGIVQLPVNFNHPARVAERIATLDLISDGRVDFGTGDSSSRAGLGALSFSFVEADEAKQWVDDYYATIASDACVPAGFAVNPNIAIVLPLMCCDDEETAIDRGLDGGHFFGYSLIHHYAIGQHRPGVTNIWEEFQKNRSLFGFDRSVASQTAQTLSATIER